MGEISPVLGCHGGAEREVHLPSPPVQSDETSAVVIYIVELFRTRNEEKLREFVKEAGLSQCYRSLRLPSVEPRDPKGPPRVRPRVGSAEELTARSLCARLLRTGRVPKEEFPVELAPEVEWRLRLAGVALYPNRKDWRVAWAKTASSISQPCRGGC